MVDGAAPRAIFRGAEIRNPKQIAEAPTSDGLPNDDG